MNFAKFNIPVGFKSTYDVTLSTVHYQFALTYVDVVIIFSPNTEENGSHSRSLLWIPHQIGVEQSHKIRMLP